MKGLGSSSFEYSLYGLYVFYNGLWGGLWDGLWDSQDGLWQMHTDAYTTLPRCLDTNC